MIPSDFPWRAGMRVRPVLADGTVQDVLGTVVFLMAGMPVVYWQDLGQTRAHQAADHLQPDRADGATLGALLAAVREAYKDPRAYVMFSRTIGAWVFTSFGRDPIESYVSEFEALLAAWRWRHK